MNEFGRLGLMLLFIEAIVNLLVQAALARLEALENDNAGIEMVEVNDDDDEASFDDEDQGQFFFLSFFPSISNLFFKHICLAH